MSEWISVKDRLPEEGVVVRTKIHDKYPRNEQDLIRRGNLWFLPGRSVYVYYTPTHWKPLFFAT